ncbi:argininosuccinate lyase [Heliorestis convoluta]|uniref:argininosuccinate lyase n=1 Tax=Heliorestis convoluta TaxID=356322 RepID=A0A5Q2N3Q8_9FIRM|nr:argininosuccinate lyase [Heliorestis convoluta]
MKKGLSFREAHEIVGKMVFLCLEKGLSLDELSLEDYQRCSPVFEEDVFEAIDVARCVNDRKVPGGPAVEAVQKAIQSVQQRLNL